MQYIHLDRIECQELLEYIEDNIGKDTLLREINSYFSTENVQKFLFSLCKDYDIGAEKFLLQHKIDILNEEISGTLKLNRLDDDTYAIDGTTKDGAHLYTTAKNYSEICSYLQGLKDGFLIDRKI